MRVPHFLQTTCWIKLLDQFKIDRIDRIDPWIGLWNWPCTITFWTVMIWKTNASEYQTIISTIHSDLPLSYSYPLFMYKYLLCGTGQISSCQLRCKNVSSMLALQSFRLEQPGAGVAVVELVAGWTLRHNVLEGGKHGKVFGHLHWTKI